MYFLPQLFALGISLPLVTLLLAAPAETDGQGLSFRPRATLFGRSINMKCTRPQADIETINTEITRATEMVNTAAADFLKSENKDYYEGFYAKSLRDQGKPFEDHIFQVYLNLGLISASSQTDYEVTVTCDNATPFCQKGYFAHMNDGRKTMNLCDIWFDNSKVAATADAITDCQSSTPTFKSLRDFRMTKSHVIAHEWTHTSYGMGGKAGSCKSFDYAYAVDDCLSLAKGTFTRKSPRYPMPKKGPLCPDPSNKAVEGVCNPEFSQTNADSITLISTGIFYSLNCKNHIPITPSNPRRLGRRAPSDVLIIDGPQTDCNNDGSDDLGASGSTTTAPGETTPTPSATSAPSPTVAPADPPAAASCLPVPTGSVKDSHESELTKAADFSCNKYAARVVNDPTISIVQSVVSGTVTGGRSTIDIARDYTGTDSQDDVYDFTIKSVDKCSPNGGFNLPESVAGHKCGDILYHAWKDCKNQGRGGSIVAGCLTYSVSTKY